MTPEGYEQARKKLDHLKNVEMPQSIKLSPSVIAA